MSRTRFLLLLFVVSVTGLGWLGSTLAQQATAPPAGGHDEKAQQLKIIPLVTLRPGDTKELLLSTWCTVDVTRGGGFYVAEMRDGKAVGDREKSYSRAGVTVTVPTFDEGRSFADKPEFRQLREKDIAPFVVTIAAAQDAKPELLEIHLLDATCSGYCSTDFRVLVVGP